MSGLTRIQQARNMNRGVSRAGSALCALGDILQAADLERLEADQTTMNNLGHLVCILGEDILEGTHYLEEHLKTLEPAPPA